MKVTPATRVRDLQRTLIRQIFEAAPPDAINLGLGQPDLPTPDVAALAGIAGIVAGKTSYGPTAGDARLRHAVAETYRPFASGPDEVLITVGSQEAMTVALLTLVDAGDEVLYPDPGYPAYPVLAGLVGARGVPYPLSAANGFRIHPADIAERIGPRTRLVIVTEPSNPTGAFSDRAALVELADLLDRRGVPWLSDEIYAGFWYDRPFVSLAALAPGAGVVVSGVSKDMSMTGWRVGWLVAPAEVVTRATAVHQYLVTCASSVSQCAALGAFTEEGRAAKARYLERFRLRREVMAEELSRLPGVRFAPPDGAFYFFVDVSAWGSSYELSQRILARRKVITVPGVAFGERGEGFLRLSFAASESDIRSGIRRIGEELAIGSPP